MTQHGFADIERFGHVIERLREPTMTVGSPAGELAEVSLAVSTVLQPGLDASLTNAALGRLAASCEQPTREAVVDGLVRSGALRGDRATYGDWRNSCLDHVVATGKGIPITLAIVVVEVARRLGVPLHGVGMPAHFLVGDERDGDWYLDAFNGTVLDRTGCRALLASLAGQRLAWDDAYLGPTPTIDIVTRMLNNLRASLTAARRQQVRLALVMRMRMLVPGSDHDTAAAVAAMAVFN